MNNDLKEDFLEKYKAEYELYKKEVNAGEVSNSAYPTMEPGKLVYMGEDFTKRTEWFGIPDLRGNTTIEERDRTTKLWGITMQQFEDFYKQQADCLNLCGIRKEEEVAVPKKEYEINKETLRNLHEEVVNLQINVFDKMSQNDELRERVKSLEHLLSLSNNANLVDEKQL